MVDKLWWKWDLKTLKTVDLSLVCECDYFKPCFSYCYSEFLPFFISLCFFQRTMPGLRVPAVAAGTGMGHCALAHRSREVERRKPVNVGQCPFGRGAASAGDWMVCHQSLGAAPC